MAGKAEPERESLISGGSEQASGGINSEEERISKCRSASIKKFVVSFVLIMVVLIVYSWRREEEAANRTARKLQEPLKIRNLDLIKNEDLSLTPSDHGLDGDHNHEPFVLSYPAVGMPTPGQPFNNKPICFKDYRNYELEQDQLFKPYKETDCKHERYGERIGSGFILCKNFLEHSQVLLNFGVTAGDQFGCRITSNYFITNYLYGCNCQQQAICRENEKRTVFEPICVSQMSEVNRENTFTSIKDEIEKKGLKGKRLLLKLDVNGAEWMALKTLPIEYLDYFDQMVIVFNNPRHPEITPPLQGYLDIIRSLKQKFVSINFHINNFQCIHDFQSERSLRKYRSSSIEVTLVNRKLITRLTESRSYLTNLKNLISTIMQSDCQMTED